MSAATDGQISFGLLFEDQYEFPWSGLGSIYSYDDWWREEAGFKPSFYPFTEEGDYAPGVTKDDPRIDQYFDERKAWDKANPLPFEVVNACSSDYEVIILAVPGTIWTASRGYPENLDLSKLRAEEEKQAELLEFCEKYSLKFKEGFCWRLSSFWG